MTTDERQKLSDIHDFLFKAPVQGRPTRAQQIEDLLAAVRTGKMSMRAILWFAGTLVAIGAAVAQFKGWFNQ